MLDGQQVEIRLHHELLARARADDLRHRVGDALELAEALHLLDEPRGRLHLEHVLEPPRDGVEARLPESEAHAALGSELVDQERVGRALDVTEEERRAAGLDRAVDDLGRLEVRIDLGLDRDELALALQEGDPVAQVREGHRAILRAAGSRRLGVRVRQRRHRGLRASAGGGG